MGPPVLVCFWDNLSISENLVSNSFPELGDSELRSCKNVLVTGVDKEEEVNESDLSDGVDGVKRNEGVDGESDDDILFSVFSLLLTLLVGSDVKADADLLMPKIVEVRKLSVIPIKDNNTGGLGIFYKN